MFATGDVSRRTDITSIPVERVAEGMLRSRVANPWPKSGAFRLVRVLHGDPWTAIDPADRLISVFADRSKIRPRIRIGIEAVQDRRHRDQSCKYIQRYRPLLRSLSGPLSDATTDRVEFWPATACRSPSRDPFRAGSWAVARDFHARTREHSPEWDRNPEKPGSLIECSSAPELGGRPAIDIASRVNLDFGLSCLRGRAKVGRPNAGDRRIEEDMP